MTSSRLLAIALLVSSLPAFTQDQKQTTSVSGIPPGGQNQIANEASKQPAESWRFIPQIADLGAGQNPLNQMRADQYRFDLRKNTYLMKTETDPPMSQATWPPDADSFCFTMRSYVVARDSKDSDSTHPVGYSTCRRSSRYHLKTTVGEPVSLQR